MRHVKAVARGILAAGMILIGVRHFTHPAGFVTIMPSYLPWPLELVYLSGFFEVMGGAGLLIPRTRRWAAWGLIALFIAVFPANLNMALNNLPFNGEPVPPLMLWLRLPMQGLLIAWAWWMTRPDEQKVLLE
jgi:uncharacterized membrane protein